MFLKEYESFNKIGVEPQRSYYIPFAQNDKPKTIYNIIDRKSSSRFVSLDGNWSIKEHKMLDTVDINENLTENINVPSCVQMWGYDHLQYINA